MPAIPVDTTTQIVDQPQKGNLQITWETTMGIVPLLKCPGEKVHSDNVKWSNQNKKIGVNTQSHPNLELAKPGG